MKKIIKTLLVVMVVVLALTAFVACDKECAHTGGTATCTEAAVCELCGASYGSPLGHSESFTTPVDPTCTEAGISGKSYCTRCDVVLVEEIVIPATGHTAGDAATCTTAQKCETCGLVLVEALGHTDADENYVCDVCEEKLHVNKLVVGADNKIVITDALDNGAGYYITWVLFTAEEAGTYTFAGEGLTIWVFDATGTTLLCGMTGTATLEPGTYAICLAVTEPGGTGEFTATVTFTAAAAPAPHEHEYAEVVTNPTCTEAGYTTHTCACGESYTDTPVDALGHAYTDGVCGNCSATDPNHYFVVSIADALKKAEGDKVQITGTVNEIYQAYNSQYNNISVWITDETGNRILLFRLPGNFGIGDKLTIKGTVTMYNEKPQIAAGATVLTSEKHICSEWTEATCKDLAACVVCGATTGELATNHNYADGLCTICGGVDPDAEGEVKAPVTVSKTMAELITANGWTSSTTKQTFKLDDNVTVKINGGSNTGKAYNGDHIRIYATDTPAGTITISVPEGYELVSIKITTQTGTYAFLYVDGTTTDICNNTVSVSGNSVVLNSVKNGSDGKQVRVTGIEVIYVEK